VRTLVVVGHDPSVGELVEVLDDGQGSPAPRQDAWAGFRTGDVAAFLLVEPFADITPGAATLADLTVPGDGPGSAR
jgi:phosphohistidine phosphatase